MTFRLPSTQAPVAPPVASAPSQTASMEPISALHRLVTSVAPERAAVGIASESVESDLVYAEELAFVEKAVPARRREFVGGRAAARHALAQLGCPRSPILVGEGREPCWPRGYVGSISHCEKLCCAVTANVADWMGVGIDVEVTGGVSPELYSILFSQEELEHISKLPNISGVHWPTIGFSAKESFYKCYFPLIRERIDFLDAVLHIEANSAQSSGSFQVYTRNGLTRLDPELRSTGRWAAGIELSVTAYSVQ
ncbi:4'-phosphopantetheinyl transferase family protein [Phenylobacterium sp.]|uniref:4'-phosphopantetheinyl transferase family protein n=1 Tax=Phenylobacterium sp. TaxID=1871053 RepID=UPI003FA79C42